MSIIEDQTLKILNNGTKEYNFSSYFLSDEEMLGASYLHYWFSYCDEAINGGKYNETVQSLKNQTRIITSHSPLSPPFEILKKVMQKHSIPFHYPLEYLEGLGMKSCRLHFNTLNELDCYCYRMTSTRGLMMAHVVGVTNEVALKGIKALSIAFELTQIGVGLKKDPEKHICFIPQEILASYDITAKEILKKENESILHTIAEKFINRANLYFRSGQDCINYFPLRSALMIYILVSLEKEIGKKALNSSLGKISNFKIFYLMLKSFFIYFIKFFPKRVKTAPLREFSKVMKFD